MVYVIALLLVLIYCCSVAPQFICGTECARPCRYERYDEVYHGQPTPIATEARKIEVAARPAVDDSGRGLSNTQLVEEQATKTGKPYRYSPLVLQAVQNMKPGEISGVIQVDQTYTIVRLNAHIAAGSRKFDEVKDSLRKQMEKTKTEELRSALGKRLRTKAKIEEL